MPRAFAFVIGAVLPLSWGLPSNLRAAWTVLVFGVLTVLLLAGRARMRPDGGTWIAAAYLAGVSTLIAGFQADNLGAHIQNGVYLIVLWGLAPPAFRWLASERSDILRSAAIGVIAGQSLSAAVAAAQALGGGTVLGIATEYGRASGLSGHPNILGIMGAVVLLMVITHMRGAGKPWKVLAAALNLAGVLATGSLTATLALLVGILVVILVYRVRLRVVFWSGVGLSLVGAIFVVVASRDGSLRTPWERVLQVTGQTGYISTASTRSETFDAAWRGIVRDPLLGVGLDDESGVTNLILDGEVVTHNIVLRAWFQGGIVLLIAVILIYALSFALIASAVRRRLAAGEAAILATMLMFALTSATLQQPYFWLIVVAAAASAAMKVRGVQRPTHPRIYRRSQVARPAL
ncbi:O-antigen ligase [Microbacterium sp. SORGH_AS 505]|uniref:O-antigen ligase family protein n=1 Tax=Microbacterium sp. SORGH_AS_0505 TaxID=3041770 RepID=UPI0027892E5C|nr:O-antigen ligase family protein [Microbacterium sp. SORGH_AS_0505]MDQ1125483.1 O-antigen ligase [Microbacterium sp. SORGH_AS_0505]